MSTGFERDEIRPEGVIRWVAFFILTAVIMFGLPELTYRLGWFERPKPPGEAREEVAEDQPQPEVDLDPLAEVNPLEDPQLAQAEDPQEIEDAAERSSSRPDPFEDPFGLQSDDPPVELAESDGPGADEPEDVDRPSAELAEAAPSDVEVLKPQDLRVGASWGQVDTDAAYQLALQLDQAGAGIAMIQAITEQAGLPSGQPDPDRPLSLVGPSGTGMNAESSFTTLVLTLASEKILDSAALDQIKSTQDALVARMFNDQANPDGSLVISFRERISAARQLRESLRTHGPLLSPGQALLLLATWESGGFVAGEAQDNRKRTPKGLPINLSEALGADERQALLSTAQRVAEAVLEPSLKPWKVLRDAQGQVVRQVQVNEPENRPEINSDEPPSQINAKQVRLQTNVGHGEAEVQITKTFTLYEGRNYFRIDLALANLSGLELSPIYFQSGPRGMPLEGIWYSTTFRDTFLAARRNGGVQLNNETAKNVLWYDQRNRKQPSAVSADPLVMAGVETQYYAVFLSPRHGLEPNQRYDARTRPFLVQEDREDERLVDVSVRMQSQPVRLGPDQTVRHIYLVYAGPKEAEALELFEAEELATFRRGWFAIPGAGLIAKYFITPLLKVAYGFTNTVSNLFGGTTGSYGVAIILLTVMVRLLISPISYRQSIMAKKMQELQPKMAELKQKYGEDKQRMAQESMGLYAKYKVNPLAGCLPALLQMPIFVGLWQALNNSPALRHSEFLYIKNLAAPDMLTKWPGGFELPILGPYFNLLPVVAAVLMFIQLRMFTPPATTPEAEMQQSILKFMPIMMGVFFFKVPAGLCLYFSMSSLWSMSERIVINRITPKGLLKEPPAETRAGSDRNGKPEPKPGGFMAKLQAMAEEAQKQQTIRNEQRPREDQRRPGGTKSVTSAPQSQARKRPKKKR